MTDNEIIKVYDGLTARQQLNIFRNLYYKEGNATERGIIANAINEILPEFLQQKAEIEKLQKKYDMSVAEGEADVKGFTADIEKWKKNCDELYEQMSERQKAEVEIAKRMGKVEAIKEFAAKIKKDAEWICDDSYIEGDLIGYVDTLVKETTSGVYRPIFVDEKKWKEMLGEDNVD